MSTAGFLDSREFYELMQSYRHTPLDAAQEFEAVKSALRAAIAPPVQPAELVKLPRHKFWGAGESNCPPELKSSNGELHTLRCKVCGYGWRKSVDLCFGSAAIASQERAHGEHVVVSVTYADGTIATGPEPLPEMSPRQLRMLANIDAIESMQGGANGPTIQLRGFIKSIAATSVNPAQPAPTQDQS